MGKLRFVALSLAIAACGSDDRNGPADASIDAKVIPPPDAKVFMDAPPPTYDLTCYGMTPPTTVDAMVTITGETQTLGQNGQVALGGIEVSAFKVGSNTASATATSSTDMATKGQFSLGPITTGGDAIDYVKAKDPATTPTYRTTYLYPQFPLGKSFDGLPGLVVSNQILGLLQQIGAPEQNDTDNGMLIVIVNDCSTTAPQGINGATLSVKQGSTELPDVIDVGGFASQFAGIFFVLNVPDGVDTVVQASYDGKMFPARTVVAHKKPAGNGAIGTVTSTIASPGPIL